MKHIHEICPLFADFGFLHAVGKQEFKKPHYRKEATLNEDYKFSALDCAIARQLLHLDKTEDIHLKSASEEERQRRNGSRGPRGYQGGPNPGQKEETDGEDAPL